MAGPYRDSSGFEVLEAPTREGTARLEVGPRHVILEVADRVHLTITDSWMTVVGARRGRKKAKPRSMRLRTSHSEAERDGAGARRVVVARAVPTEDIALWHESRAGIFFRVASVRPIELMDKDALAAWRKLDQLALRMRAALAHLGGGAVEAIELGRGQHRVLSVAHADRVVVYARPLFRERPRRALEVREDGAVVAVGRDREQEIRCTSRYGVTVLGDRIRIAPDDGGPPLALWLPWISQEDREELARRLGAVVDRAAGDDGSPRALGAG